MTTRAACSAHRAASALLLVVVSCRGDGGSPGPALEVDTLPGGTIVVSNPARGLWDSAEAWRLVEDLRIGSADGDGATTFADITGLAADRGGRIYVLDRQSQDVRVFAPEGSHIRTIGRRGDGPGEFSDADALWVDDSLRLWVSDRGSRRFSAFDSSGRFLTDYPRNGPAFAPNFVGGEADGDLWDAWWINSAPGEPARKDLLRFSRDGYRDTVTLPAFRETQWRIVRRQGAGTNIIMNFPVPFTARELLAVDPAGGVWRAVSDQYRLTRFRERGDSTRVLLREYAAIPVTPADRERAAKFGRALADQGADIDESLIPRVKPAMHALLVDDQGYAWVALYTDDDSADIRFDVFDVEGRYLGAVPTPVTPQRLRPVPVVRATSLYYVALDTLDVPYVVRARIVGRD